MFVKSPLNYTGGKYRLLPQLIPLFPIANRMFDLFCGGFNVGINYRHDVVGIDKSMQLIDLFQHFKEYSLSAIVLDIEQTVRKYRLSKTNAEGYYALRQDYNSNPQPILLYALISHSFNHQMRFNSKSEFNMPFGRERSCFNKNLKNNLISFIRTLHEKNVRFECCDFFDVNDIEEGDFVYCDPPYRITLATYNEQYQWNVESDKRLFSFLDELELRNVHFGLSNVIRHGDQINEELQEWSKKYKTHLISANYNNCSYHKKNKSHSEEVYITNYSPANS